MMRLQVELHADGGIRLGTPGEDTARHIATLDKLRDWVGDAVRRGHPVVVTGEVSAPPARVVLEAITEAGAEPTVTESVPEPWSDGLSALQLAAREGWEAHVTDLLERGASSDAADPAHTPYRLAMFRGHVRVLQALRAAGVPDPVTGSRPGGASPDAVTLRAYVSRTRQRVVMAILAAPVLLGAVGALALGAAAALVTGVVVTVAVLPLVALLLYIVSAARIVVDGTDLYARNAFERWRGPVDLRRLVALGYNPPMQRQPPCFRLIQPDAGTRLVPGALYGFDSEVAKTIREHKGLKVVRIGFRLGGYLMPGLPRFVGSCVAGTDAELNQNARTFLEQVGGLEAQKT